MTVRRTPKLEPALRIRLHRSPGERDTLLEAMEMLQTRRRGDRLRYLATLGLRAEQAGIHLENQSIDGRLMLPATISAPAQPAASKPLDPKSEKARKDQQVTKNVRQLLNLAMTDTDDESPAEKIPEGSPVKRSNVA